MEPLECPIVVISGILQKPLFSQWFCDIPSDAICKSSVGSFRNLCFSNGFCYPLSGILQNPLLTQWLSLERPWVFWVAPQMPSDFLHFPLVFKWLYCGTGTTIKHHEFPLFSRNPRFNCHLSAIFLANVT